MKKARKKLGLSRETLRSLETPMLARMAGGATVSNNDGCNTTCNCTVTCATDCAGATCLPCTGNGQCSH